MDMYITIYRGETIEDEIEINVHGIYREEDDELEILEVVNSFNDEPITLTPEEIKTVEGKEVNKLLEMRGRYDLVEMRTTTESERMSVRDRIIKAQNVHLRASNETSVPLELEAFLRIRGGEL